MITVVDLCRHRPRMMCNQLIEDVVLMDGDLAQAPAGATKVFTVGINSDCVARKRAQQRAESGYKGSVYIIRKEDEVGPALEDRSDASDGLVRKSNGAWVAGIDDKEGLDFLVKQLVEIVA